MHFLSSSATTERQKPHKSIMVLMEQSQGKWNSKAGMFFNPMFSSQQLLPPQPSGLLWDRNKLVTPPATTWITPGEKTHLWRGVHLVEDECYASAKPNACGISNSSRCSFILMTSTCPKSKCLSHNHNQSCHRLPLSCSQWMFLFCCLINIKGTSLPQISW